MNEYKNAVIQYRKEHGITQEEFAKLCGLSRATVCSIERKEHCYVQVVTKSKLEKVLKEDKQDAEVQDC